MVKVKPPSDCTRHNCNGCEYAEFHGLERKLIMRGKNKGKYTVTNFYSCNLNKTKEIQNGN